MDIDLDSLDENEKRFLGGALGFAGVADQPRRGNKRGDGVAPLKHKDLPKKIKDNIEMLGKLNDRYTKHLGRRSRHGLFILAAAYRKKGMPMMAAQVRAEAQDIKAQPCKTIITDC